MKKAFILLTGLITLAACKKLTSLADINFSVPVTKTFSVEGLPNSPYIPPGNGLTASIPAIPVATQSQDYIGKNNTSSNLVKEVKLGELKLDIDEPLTQTFDLVDSIWLYLSANGLQEILVAHKYDIPKGVRTISLNTSEDNIKDYFLKDTVSFRMQGHFYNAPDSATQLTLSLKFNAVANPLSK